MIMVFEAYSVRRLFGLTLPSPLSIGVELMAQRAAHYSAIREAGDLMVAR